MSDTTLLAAPDQAQAGLGLMPQPPGGAVALPSRPEPAGALAVAHVADFSRRYPGETVTFFTRVEVRTRLPGFRLQVSLPEGLIAGDARLAANGGRLPEIAPVGPATYIVWNVDGPAGLQAGDRYEFQLEARVAPTERDLFLESRAVVTSRPGEAPRGREARAEESAVVAVAAKSRYLKFLPALYYEDDLMGRFLMIFESFWDPIVSQINQMPVYFDPKLTQVELLPWLGSWIGLSLDERWPEDRRRQLLQAGVSLFRKRGTKRGLQEYLEIYTGRRPRIIEHGADNFRLGPDARLGSAIAFGKGNRPHTFSLRLSLPPVPLAEAETEADRARKEELRRRTIISIVESEKPAHTDYVLELEIEQ